MEWSYIPLDSDKGFTNISLLESIQFKEYASGSARVVKTQCLINLAKSVMLR